MDLLVLLCVILVVLKIAGIDISWWVVFFPMFLHVGLWLLFFVVAIFGERR